MIRIKRVFVYFFILVLISVISTYYTLTKLSATDTKVIKPEITVESKIYDEFEKLPIQYRVKSLISDDRVETFLENVKRRDEKINATSLWGEAQKWVTKTQLVNIKSPQVGDVYNALKIFKIIKADVHPKGTQLKFLLTLEGNQHVIFKPQWYHINTIIEGPVYAGKDRYGSEIVAFYLSIILNKPLVPFSVEREISLHHDIIPVATRALAGTSYVKEGATCIYGKCFYCKKENPICDNKNSKLTGTVILNINGSLKIHKHPWRRTYQKNQQAVWEKNTSYCKSVRNTITKKRLYDLIDISIFDFLIQNGDRHHYETLNDQVLILDNGKGLGMPYIDHIDILAPLYQCCILRRETWKILLSLTGGKLREKLELMPDIHNVITDAHLLAIEKRLLLVFATIEYCRKIKKADSTLFH